MSDDTAPPAGQADQRKPLVRRGALMAGVGFVALFAGGEAYRRWASSYAVEAGITLHAQPRALLPLHFTDERGAETGLTAFHGRTVLLNVWAT